MSGKKTVPSWNFDVAGSHEERGRWVHDDDSDAEEAPEADTPPFGDSPPDEDERLPW